MRLTFNSEKFAIFDDVLSDIQFSKLWEYVCSENYRSFHSHPATGHVYWKIFHGSDTAPLRGPDVISAPLIPDFPSFPTRTTFDIFIKFLLDHHSAFQKWVGRKKVDWDLFTAMPSLMPAGSVLNWHSDPTYAGSYAFYVHPFWDIEWGGELLITSKAVPRLGAAKRKAFQARINQAIQYRGSFMASAERTEAILTAGYGHYIFPKPNRLVLISRGIYHKVNKVGSSAGDNFRSSIGGFFLRKSSLAIPEATGRSYY